MFLFQTKGFVWAYDTASRVTKKPEVLSTPSHTLPLPATAEWNELLDTAKAAEGKNVWKIAVKVGARTYLYASEFSVEISTLNYEQKLAVIRRGSSYVNDFCLNFN